MSRPHLLIETVRGKKFVAAKYATFNAANKELQRMISAGLSTPQHTFSYEKEQQQ